MMRVWIEARDKPGLLIAMMRHFEAQGRISFVGELGNSDLLKLPGARTGESARPEQATELSEVGVQSVRVAFELTQENIDAIWRVVTSSERLAAPTNIIHIEITVGDEVAFGAYDEFHKDCVFASKIVPMSLLERLQSSGVIRSLEVATE